MSELHHLTALAQAATVRRREVSPVELVDHYLERIARWNDAVGGFVTVTADLARQQAKEAERAVLDGAALPALHGVPTAVKDLNLTAGVPTRLGTTAMDPLDLGIDDYVVGRLRAAGTISLGKTNTPEFGLPCYTEPDVAPPARTPYDTSRSAGGSSGGAGAAVAAGLVPFAQGSDGAGSIRIPASVCGLVGVKSARGRVSSGPVFPVGAGLAVNGPLARTVRDAAALLDAMAGPMPGDPYWAPPLPPGETFLAHCEREPGRLRVGRYRDPVIARTEVHPDCVAAYDAAAARLAGLGHEVSDIGRPFGFPLERAFRTVWSVGPAAFPLDPAREGRLRPFTRWLREQGRLVSAVGYAAALGELELAARAAIEQSAAFDVVLTPTLAQPPVPLGFFRDDADPAGDFAAQSRFTPFTAPYNFTGQPALSLPLHWSAEGLPIGVQLVGRPADEATLFALAAQLEATRPSPPTPACW